jgi:hypothetical protein
MGVGQARKLREMNERAGLPIPEDLYPPILPLGLESHFSAFVDLSTTRVFGPTGPAQISWLSIEEYADRLGFHGDVRQDLHYHVRSLDEHYLAEVAKAAKQRSKRAKPDADSSGHSQGRPPPKRRSRG